MWIQWSGEDKERLGWVLTFNRFSNESKNSMIHSHIIETQRLDSTWANHLDSQSILYLWDRHPSADQHGRSINQILETIRFSLLWSQWLPLLLLANPVTAACPHWENYIFRLRLPPPTCDLHLRDCLTKARKAPTRLSPNRLLELRWFAGAAPTKFSRLRKLAGTLQSVGFWC